MARTPPVIPGLKSTSITVPTIMFESKHVHALPALLAAMHDAQLRLYSGGTLTLSTATHDLPRTDKETALISAFLSVFASILILVPFAFVAASFVTPLVRERESGSKQMQFVSGSGTATYWLASWAWDLLLLLAVLVLTLAVFLLMGRKEFTGTPELVTATTLLLVGFGTASIGVASVASFAFSSPSSALIVLIAFHFLSGFGLIVTDFILFSIGGSTADVDKSLRAGLFPLFPAYCLGRGFFVLSTRTALATIDASLPPPLFVWDEMGAPLAFLAGETVVTYLLTLLLQVISSYPRIGRALLPSFALRALGISQQPPPANTAIVAPSAPLLAPQPAAAPHTAADGPNRPPAMRSTSLTELEDESVAEERAAVDALVEGGGAAAAAATTGGLEGALVEGAGENELVLMHLRKVYGGAAGKVAVRDLCLRVRAGECFGFLGVNGAGKSTTFSMLTGATTPTSGDAKLRGMSILSDQDAIRRLVGFCPQHDALESLLTARETLTLYARIKGVPSSEIDAEVDGLLADLDLAMFAQKLAGTLSGGNKRKLCVGVALIGGPQLALPCSYPDPNPNADPPTPTPTPNPQRRTRTRTRTTTRTTTPTLIPALNLTLTLTQVGPSLSCSTSPPRVWTLPPSASSGLSSSGGLPIAARCSRPTRWRSAKPCARG